MLSDSDVSESEFDRILEQTKSEKGRKKVIDWFSYHSVK